MVGSLERRKDGVIDQLEIGQVLDVSRRHVMLLTSTGTISGTISSKALDLVPGDRVKYEYRDKRVFVTEALPAQRTLSRSYRGGLKRMGANIDLLCVITAVGATLNTITIDRMLVAARIQDIPVALILNKSDQERGQSAAVIDVYRDIGIKVIECSAKFGQEFDQLENLIRRAEISVVALCGVSGVGKSTILNRLIPDAAVRTGEVSVRTGQGKQTTSQPRGFLYSNADESRRIIIDFPGVGFFGLSHVECQALSSGFDEFAVHAQNCRFLNCRHMREPDCGVRQGVESGAIAEWRYASYLQIFDEIEDAKEFG